VADGPIDYNWWAPNYSKLRIEIWADEAVVFNPQSGETHQLNDLAITALDLMQQPFTLETLSKKIDKFYEIEDPKILTHQLKSLITQFDNLGLIEPYLE
jgi:PqqD family protein of HPr-rel-A system